MPNVIWNPSALQSTHIITEPATYTVTNNYKLDFITAFNVLKIEPLIRICLIGCLNITLYEYKETSPQRDRI